MIFFILINALGRWRFCWSLNAILLGIGARICFMESFIPDCVVMRSFIVFVNGRRRRFWLFCCRGERVILANGFSQSPRSLLSNSCLAIVVSTFSCYTILREFFVWSFMSIFFLIQLIFIIIPLRFVTELISKVISFFIFIWLI